LFLDYSLQTIESRKEFVDKLLSEYTPNSNELSLLGDYLLFTRDKNQTKKERKEDYPITTPNREHTIDKRQISYEGLIDRLENGEDGLYSIMCDNKEMKLDNKDPLTEEDIKNIPGIAEGLDVIKKLEWQYQHATGQRRKNLKKTIIETWKQLYLIKSSHKMALNISTNKTQYLANIDIPETIYWKDGYPYSDDLLTLLNPDHVSFLLQYYQPLKEESWYLLESDMLWHLIDLEEVASAALEQKYPMLWDILIWKVDGRSNKQIQELALKHYGVNHTEQYYSSIWRKRIPKLISKEVQKRYILKHYLNNYKIDSSLSWKTCSKCGKVMPAHPFFFPKNSNKEGFYSQCRECRNGKEEK